MNIVVIDAGGPITRVTPRAQDLFERAREGSVLHKKQCVYLERVTVIEAFPDSYETRLTEMYAGAFTRIRLFAPEAHDLALMKLQRNIERDREDVKHLAKVGLITSGELRDRYQKEIRPYIASSRAAHGPHNAIFGGPDPRSPKTVIRPIPATQPSPPH